MDLKKYFKRNGVIVTLLDNYRAETLDSLILLGAERLVREGKWVMYTVTLGALHPDQLLYFHYDLYLSGAVFWNVFDHGILYHDGRAEQ